MTIKNKMSTPQTWIFQANPAKYKILESLKSKQKELWNLRQHAKDVMIGDRVLIWISGKDAGIYAIGTVRSSPAKMPDSEEDMPFWIAPEEGKRVISRVWVEYSKIFLEKPLYRRFIEFDPVLENLAIIKFPRGTNFKVQEAEWIAIENWLRDSPDY